MLYSIIFWVLLGSALLWVGLFNVLLASWVYATIKKLLFGKKQEVEAKPEQA